MRLKLISIGRLPWYRPTQSTHSYFTPKLSLPLLAAYTDKIWDIEIEESIY